MHPSNGPCREGHTVRPRAIKPVARWRRRGEACIAPVHAAPASASRNARTSRPAPDDRPVHTLGARRPPRGPPPPRRDLPPDARSPSSAPPRRREPSAGRSSGTCSRARSAAPSTRSTRTGPRSSAIKAYPIDRRDRRARGPRGHRHPGEDRARARRASAARPASRAIIIISAGFKEVGAEGVELERQVLEAARRDGIRVIGPNCLGVMNPIDRHERHVRRRASPARARRLHQPVGALLTAILDWSLAARTSASARSSRSARCSTSAGATSSTTWATTRTPSRIVIYMETIGDARAFLSAAREVAMTKPIIVIKPGRTAQAAKAAAIHTGSLTGSDDVLDAAFRRAGVLRVDSISELFEVSEILAKQPRPRGPPAVDRDQRGRPRRPGHRRADRRRRRAGRARPRDHGPRSTPSCPPPGATTTRSTSSATPPPERYAKALEIAAADPETDGLLVILTPQAMTDPTATAERARQARADRGQARARSVDGRRGRRGGRADPARGRHPHLRLPGHGRLLFNHLWRYGDNLQVAVRDAEPAGCARTRRATARTVDRIIADGRGRGPDAADRVRVQEGPRRLRHPDRRTRSSPQTPDEAVAAADEHRLSGRRSSSCRGRSPTRPTSAACVLNLAGRRRRARGVRADPRRRSPQGAAPSTSRASRSSRWSTGRATS